MNYKTHRIPTPVVYTTVILLLSILLILLLPKVFSVHREIDTRFQESLVEVKSNNGDILEVATYKNTTYFSESDNFDATIFGITIPLGKTESFLSVPVNYRFHVRLSDNWKITTTPETVTVIAPDIRPTLPPAPDISAMEVITKKGWARFNDKDIEKRIKSQVTSTLNIRAYKLTKEQLIRDAARHSIEESLKKYIPWLPQEYGDKVFTVKFEGEIAEKSKAMAGNNNSFSKDRNPH